MTRFIEHATTHGGNTPPDGKPLSGQVAFFRVARLDASRGPQAQETLNRCSMEFNVGFFNVGWTNCGEAGCRRHKKLRVDVQKGTTSFSDSTYVLGFLCCAPSLIQAGPPRRKRGFVGWPNFGEVGCRRHKKFRVHIQKGTTSFSDSIYALNFLCCAPSLIQAGPPRVHLFLPVLPQRFTFCGRDRGRRKCGRLVLRQRKGAGRHDARLLLMRSHRSSSSLAS